MQKFLILRLNNYNSLKNKNHLERTDGNPLVIKADFKKEEHLRLS